MIRILSHTILLGILPLIAITILQIILERVLKIMSHLQQTQVEERGVALYLLQFISDLFFFVVVPTLVYYWIYPVMPFEGYKVGVAIGIAAYVLGGLPYAINLSLRVKIPAAFIVATLFFNLLKLTFTLGVITHFLNY